MNQVTLAEEVMAKNATVSPDREQVATFTLMTKKKTRADGDDDDGCGLGAGLFVGVHGARGVPEKLLKGAAVGGLL